MKSEQGAFQALNFLIITAPRPSSKSVAGWVFCMDGYHAQLRQINPPYADKRLLEKLFQQSLAAEPVVGK